MHSSTPRGNTKLSDLEERRPINACFRMAKAVVESAEDAEGNPLYERKWDAEKIDLPVVETSKQRRPSPRRANTG